MAKQDPKSDKPITLSDVSNLLDQREAEAATPLTMEERIASLDRTQGAFALLAPDETFNGDCCGVLIKNGVGYVDNAARAHAALEYGFAAIRTATMKDAWPKDEPKKKPAAR